MNPIRSTLLACAPSPSAAMNRPRVRAASLRTVSFTTHSLRNDGDYLEARRADPSPDQANASTRAPRGVSASAAPNGRASAARDEPVAQVAARAARRRVLRLQRCDPIGRERRTPLVLVQTGVRLAEDRALDRPVGGA